MNLLSTLIFCPMVTWGILIPSVSFSVELEKIIALQQAQIQGLIEENKAIRKDIEENVKRELSACKSKDIKHEWAEGNLCILANGACPQGFTRSEGHIRAISIFEDRVNSSVYLAPAQMGSSSISWHGSPYQHGSWAGELSLSACCK